MVSFDMLNLLFCGEECLKGSINVRIFGVKRKLGAGAEAGDKDRKKIEFSNDLGYISDSSGVIGKNPQIGRKAAERNQRWMSRPTGSV